MHRYSFHVAAGLQPWLAEQGIAGLDDLFAWTTGERMDKPGLESWRQRWRIRLGRAGELPRTLYLKRFERPPLRRQWERWRTSGLAWSTAGNEWRNAQALAAAGVRAVEPVAFGQKMCGPWELHSCILLGEAPGESLERWVPGHWLAPAEERDWSQRRKLVDALARFVAGLHAAGFVHRDLYLCHIFFDDTVLPARGDGPVRTPEQEWRVHDAFCLIDLQRVFRPRWRHCRWVIKDLAALNYSAPLDRIGRWERLRFLCRYARTCRQCGSARKLAGLVQRKTDWMTRRAASASCR